GNVGDEIAPDAFELAQIGDVVQDHDCAGIFGGLNGIYRRGEETLAKRAGHDLGLDAGRALQDRAHGFEKLRLAHDLDKGTSGLRRGAEFQAFFGARVGKEQALRGVNYSDTFHHAAEDVGGKVALLGDRANGALTTSRRVVQGDGQNFQDIAGAVRLNRPKIAFGHAARKRLQALHAARERARDQKRGHSRNQQHGEGREPKPPWESPDYGL